MLSHLEIQAFEKVMLELTLDRQREPCWGAARQRLYNVAEIPASRVGNACSKWKCRELEG